MNRREEKNWSNEPVLMIIAVNISFGAARKIRSDSISVLAGPRFMYLPKRTFSENVYLAIKCFIFQLFHLDDNIILITWPDTFISQLHSGLYPDIHIFTVPFHNIFRKGHIFEVFEINYIRIECYAKYFQVIHFIILLCYVIPRKKISNQQGSVKDYSYIISHNNSN